MDYGFTEEQQALRREVRRFCEQELTRKYVRWMDEHCDFVPQELWDKMAALGFFGTTIPQEYGGSGLGLVDAMVMLEELATASVAVGLCLGATVGFGATTIKNLGTDAQKRALLPPLAQGKLRFSLALTEPAGGTDILGAIATTAVDRGDHWVLNGSKIFITGAHVADYLITVAITDPGAKRSHGLSAFLVPRQAAGVQTRLIPKLGCHAAGTNEVHFEDVRVPKENLLGTRDGAWYELLATLNPERVGTAMLSVGVAQAAFRDAMEYAQQRSAFGGPIARFQSLQHYLADIAIEIENARNLVYKCAWLHDRGAPMHLEASMAKIVAGRASEKAAIHGMEILGGYGYCDEFDMQRHFRDYKQMIFSPISDEMAKNMIMQFMGLPRSW